MQIVGVFACAHDQMMGVRQVDILIYSSQVESYLIVFCMDVYCFFIVFSCAPSGRPPISQPGTPGISRLIDFITFCTLYSTTPCCGFKKSCMSCGAFTARAYSRPERALWMPRLPQRSRLGPKSWPRNASGR